MLQCDNVVTIIHHEKEPDGDTYTCTTKSDASWFKKTAITTAADGAKPSNIYEVRIMTDDFIYISHGDYVALGIVLDIQKPADLKSVDHFRITAIADNRRGKLPHWRLSGQ
ncbi:MAG: hypothetical protein J6V06_03345 [Clostridia bacterium]|nr:hypothetical protein [Clostridia bacterium]